MKGTEIKKKLPAQLREELLATLEARFEKNLKRHPGLEWAQVKARLEAKAEKLWSLHEMESTGGEPDVVGHDAKTGEYVFFDCSAESPKGRVSLCYDREALDSRKEHKPKDNAVDVAEANVAINGLQGRIECLEAAGLDHRRIKAAGPYDLIFANILKGPLIELAPGIASQLATGGRAILSGLLVVQAEAVTAAYVAAGLCLQNRDDIGEWSTLVLQKR